MERSAASISDRVIFRSTCVVARMIRTVAARDAEAVLPPSSECITLRKRDRRAKRRVWSVIAGATIAASLTLAPAAGLTAITASFATEEVPFYTVMPAYGGEPEFLFAIAERYLGDGNRFTEIFELNKGRVQSDGLALTDPTVLNPGWVLQLPPDAQGDEVQFGPPLAAAPAPAAGDESPALEPEPVDTRTPPATAPSMDADEEPDPPAPADTADTPSAGLFIGTGIVVLLAIVAAAWLIVSRIRRRGMPGRANALPADRSSSWIIDSALKVVIGASTREGISFPGVYLVAVDDDAVHLTLTSPQKTAPTGWVASSDGRTWSASFAHIQSQQVPVIDTEPFSRLVPLGVAEPGRMLLDFARAGGPISVEGDRDSIDEVTESWVTELTHSPWSLRDQQVVRADVRDQDVMRSLDSLLDRLDQEGSGVLVLENPPARAQYEKLRALFESPDFSWVVLVKGAFGAAPWQFTVRDGVLASGLLPDVRYSASTRRPQTHTRR